MVLGFCVRSHFFRILFIGLVVGQKLCEVKAFGQLVRWCSTGRFSASGLFAETKNTLQQDQDARDVVSLQQWAHTNGVRFANGVSLATSDNKNNWGVLLKEPAMVGTRVMSVPTNLVLSSCELAEFLEPAMETLVETGVTEYQPEFLLMIRLLEERHEGPSSRWHPWLNSLPNKFNTGVYLDEVERSHLRIFASELLAAQDKQLDAFTKALRQLPPSENTAFLTNLSDEVIRWAYSVVFTRSWRSPSAQDGKAYLVPLGDMFNHRDPANVIIEEGADSIDVLLKENVDENSELLLSYGITQLPARFLVIFGFFDENCREIFANITFPNMSVRQKDMGFGDWSKMVFRTSDGAISNTVWDAMLWKILASKPIEQSALYGAHMSNDVVTKATIYSRYELEMSQELLRHVQDTLDNTYPIDHTEGNSSATVFAQHPRLELISRYSKWMRAVLERVNDQIDNATQNAEREV